MFFSQNWDFFYFLLYRNMDQEKIFGEVLERKEALFVYRKHRFKKRPKI